MGSLSSKPLHTDDELRRMAFHGTVVSLHETSGVVSFVLGKTEVRARFERANTCLDGRVVPQGLPLAYTIRVGMRAYVHFVENEHDAASAVRYRAHVDVIATATRCQPEDYPRQEFRGTVVTEYTTGSKQPGVASIFLNGAEEKVIFRPYNSDVYCENWPVGRKVDICGIYPRNGLLEKEARYEARNAITPSTVTGSQINTIVSFDSSTRSGSFFYDNYNGKLVIDFVAHEIRSHYGQADLALPELLSHLYAGQEIEIAGFPEIMCQHDVYQVKVIINVGGQSIFVAGRKLKDHPDLLSVEDRLSLDRLSLDRATVDRTAINCAALCKSTFTDVKQFLANERIACPPDAARPDEFNLDNKREVTNVERSRCTAAAQTVDPANERPSTSARNADAAFVDDLVRHSRGVDGDSDHVRREDTTPKVDLRNQCASTSGQLTESRYADDCIRDNLREAESSAYVDRDETTVKDDVTIAQTATSEWYSEEAFTEQYICGGLQDASRTEYSIRGTARTGLAGEQESVWPNGPTMFGLSSTTALLDLQVDAKETGESENDVVSSGTNKSERKVDSTYFGVESKGQDKSENASRDSSRGPTTDTFVPDNSTGKDREAARAEPALTKTVPFTGIRTVPSAQDTQPIEPTYSGIISAVSERSCVVAFRLNGREEAARCCRAYATLDGLPVQQDVSLKVTLEVGARAELSRLVPYNGEPNSVFRIRYKAVVDVKGPSTDAPQPIEPTTYSGVIWSVNERSCVVAFTLNGREEAARCCRADATLDGQPVQQDVSLKVTLEVGAIAVLSHVEEYFVESDNERGIWYKAVVDVEGE